MAAIRDGLETAADYERLNLGCGHDYDPVAWNVDISERVGPDEVHDLEETPWPWADSSFDEIEARHVLEHLDPVPWTEISRVLKPDGRFYLTYPIGHTRFEDPTHRQYWNWNTSAAIAGERSHPHEYTDAFQLVNRDLEWNANSRLARLYTRVKLTVDGPGAWLGQIPGLYGEVTAVYTRR